MPLLQLHENKVKKLGITSPSAKQLLISPTYEEHTFGKPDCTSKYSTSTLLNNYIVEYNLTNI